MQYFVMAKFGLLHRRLGQLVAVHFYFYQLAICNVFKIVLNVEITGYSDGRKK